MMDTISLAAKAGLLHDIGKLVIRATHEWKNHSDLGADFLIPFLTDASSDESRRLLRCIRYHHAGALRDADPAADDLAWIIYEADNIAAGADRRTREAYGTNGLPSQSRFDMESSLDNIFNAFSGGGKESWFKLLKKDDARTANYPVSRKLPASQGLYTGIYETVKANFQRKDPLEMTENELLRILEDTTDLIPSSTAREEVNDISLFDHLKLTGALAGAMVKYFQSRHITNYKEACFEKGKINRDEKEFLFISGDFSGIQKFIYRIPSSGAMRMLRGRSFYLDILLEHIVDELLEKLSLSRANLIYCSGGHFYLLTDNTEKTKKIVRNAEITLNRQLTSLFSGTLYLALGMVEVCANDLMEPAGNGTRTNIFRAVSEKVSLSKQHRYDETTLSELFDEHSAFNEVSKGNRECAICHSSERHLSSYAANHSEDDVEVCDTCNGLYLLGKSLIDEGKTLFAVLEDSPMKGSIPLPSLDSKTLSLLPASEEDLEKWKKEGLFIRIYDKNQSRTSHLMASRIWTADYACRGNDSHILDFNELAESSGDEYSLGINRLGVLRADVDNLGAAFIAGFIRKGQNPETYATLSRYAALSRSMAYFFRRVILDICRKKLPEGIQPFYLFQDKEQSHRKIHVVYSGGDDLFLTGAWDDLLEFAVDLRRTFAVWTNEKLTFSAGLGLFSPTYPISRMAALTGNLEDLAKANPGKDSLALFGSGTEYTASEGREKAPVYHWDELIRIHDEKIIFLMNHLDLSGITKKDGRARIAAGKSLLYRLMTLLKSQDKGRMDLARFAYTLARLEPAKKEGPEIQNCYEEVRNQLYRWAVSEKDRKELTTAIQLIVYRMRDKEQK